MKRMEAINEALSLNRDTVENKGEEFLGFLESWGYTVVPDNDWAFMARFSMLPGKTKGALIDFLDETER
ncbi:MAG: hypothetical protein MJH10_09235 [Epibacterium sp.]|nr:hypothetical protein [Epibacterium sp.]NQX73718.1 hypothetical protein [Epibacterium sp.]